MVARMWWLDSGHGRPAYCTETCTSVELSLLTHAGWSRPPTALSSESSFLGLQKRGWEQRRLQGRRRVDGCPMAAPLGFSLGEPVTSKHMSFLPGPASFQPGLSYPLTFPDPPHPSFSAPVPVPQEVGSVHPGRCAVWSGSSLPQVMTSQCPCIPGCQTLGRDLKLHGEPAAGQFSSILQNHVPGRICGTRTPGLEVGLPDIRE